MSTVRSTVIPLAAVALVAACSPNAPESAALDPRLESDLARASAAFIELAPNGGTEVRSADELVPRSMPESRAAAPAPVRRAPAPVVAAERIVEPSPAATAPAPAPEAVMIAEAPVEAPMPVDAPSSAPRPQAPDVVPVSGPAPGDGVGGWIGVVIRGGMGGWDDCAAHDRARRGGRPGGVHVSINERLPSAPAGAGTPIGMRGADAGPRIEMGRPVSGMPARGGILRPGGFR